MRIHLVRHGETLFNTREQLQGWCDSPLTERGRRQAEALGEHLRGLPITKAFTSDLTRARETARAALRHLPEVALEETPDLREWHFGGFEALPNAHMWEPVYAVLGANWYDPESRAHVRSNGSGALVDAIAALDPSRSAENAVTVERRVARAVARILSASVLGDVLVVTHGAVMSNLVEVLAPDSRPATGFPNGGVQTITVNAGITTVEPVLVPRLPT